MTVTADPRVATPRRFLMCPPVHFAVDYSINPWMDPAVPVDAGRALEQWETLRRTYLDLGHEVETIAPLEGLPDMVFAANGGTVAGGVALGARFHHPQRAAEGPAYQRWFQAAVDAGTLKAAVVPAAVNEGEGDVLQVGGLVLAGTGFRTDPAAHAELQELFGLPVVSLVLVDPRYYHLDTALAVLDDQTVAYYPGAFSEGSQEVLHRLFPDAVIATEQDAAVLGLNAVSDGRHVVLSAQAHLPWSRSCACAASCRSASTPPSCARPAAARSAARWSCAPELVADTAVLSAAGPPALATPARPTTNAAGRGRLGLLGRGVTDVRSMQAALAFARSGPGHTAGDDPRPRRELPCHSFS